MAIFTSPTTTDVQDEAKLRPEQVRKTFTANDYAADVDGRISEEQAFVEARLMGRYNVDSEADLTDNENTLATHLIELRTLASLYHTAGQLNEAYKNEALDYERRATELMDALFESIGSRQSTLSPTTTFSRTLRRVDGYSARCGEYACDD